MDDQITMITATVAVLAFLVSLQSGEAIDSRRPSGVTGKREIGNCPSMDRVMYYQETQIAKAQVINMGLIPTFTLKSSNDLVRTICPKCLNSSIKGEFQVDLGQLAREMAEKNITLWMSWDLHSSRKVKCKEGGLTWLYSTESNSLSIVERPELVEVVTEPDSVDSVINKTETSGGGNRVHSQALLTIVSLAIPVTLLCG